MSARVTNVRFKDGKLVRVHRLSVSAKIGNKAKADREAKKWISKSKKPQSPAS